jgi:type VI protein secretion system component VasF
MISRDNFLVAPVAVRAALPAAAGVDDDQSEPLAPQVHAVKADRVRAGRAATVGGAAIGVVVIALPTYVVSLYLFGGRQT